MLIGVTSLLSSHTKKPFQLTFIHIHTYIYKHTQTQIYTYIRMYMCVVPQSYSYILLTSEIKEMCEIVKIWVLS